jgi:hypothetical protein
MRQPRAGLPAWGFGGEFIRLACFERPRIHVAEDGNRWRTLVNTVINARFHVLTVTSMNVAVSGIHDDGGSKHPET